MEYQRKYVLSFGDSSRYLVPFDGSREEFLVSDTLAQVKKSVDDCLRKKFPAGGYEAYVEPEVADADGRNDFTVLDEKTMPGLLDDVVRQVEVALSGKELNDNAPFDRH